MKDDFFKAGEGIEALRDDPASAARPVLERLGPAPFKTRGFPLLGFLATLYEHVAASSCVEPNRPAEPRAETGPITPPAKA